ncbi:hypothetical protein [Flavobacterium sp.]|jgi:hypothetical protein|uniref:hypothetical protein n=1 Tax=Flavobacterium sp. TaxID=239 RepID=UPI0037BF09DB
MKKIAKFLAPIFVLAAFLGCEKDNVTSTDSLTSDDALVNTKIDIASDDVSNIVDQLFDNIDGSTIAYRGVNNDNSVFSNCATITRVPAFGTVVTPGTQVTKTIDFGTTGCQLNNGNIVKGKIIISFVFQPTAVSHTVTYTFDNFYHNNIKFVGTKTFTRTMTAATATTAPHPIVTMLLDMTITMPNGDVYTRVGSRTREMIEGFDTPQVFADNIYKITGNWNTTHPNGSVQTATITTPLRARMSCLAVNKPLLVLGVITFVKNNVTATLDYGNGDCDNTAVFTVNGNSHTIIIGN